MPALNSSNSQMRKQDSDMLFRGIICALIGAVILLAPHVARSPDIREIMGQAPIVGWFALALGAAFLIQWGIRTNRRRKAEATHAEFIEQHGKDKKPRRPRKP